MRVFLKAILGAGLLLSLSACIIITSEREAELTAQPDPASHNTLSDRAETAQGD